MVSTKPRLAYICFDVTREGQASYAHVHEIIKGLKKRGWEVDLYQPTYIYKKKSPGYPARVIEFFRMTARLSRVLHNYNCLYVRYHPLSYWAIKAACKKDCPVVLEVNGEPSEIFIVHPAARMFETYLRHIIQKSFRLSSAAIGVTKQLTSWAGQVNPKMMLCTIQNGANVDLFAPEATTHIELPENYAIFFGALAPWQGLEENILPAVHSQYWPKNVSLVIVGDGMKRAAVENAAILSKQIIWLGTLPYHEIAGIVNGSICGLVTNSMKSYRRNMMELSPLKLYETLACGVPAIVTDYRGQADLIRENKCGLIIPNESPDALAKSIQYLHEHPDVRKKMGKIARKTILAKYSWDLRAQETHQFLLQLINKD